jgi:ketosteroid isomerase-like protein
MNGDEAMSSVDSKAIENKRTIQQIFGAIAEGDWQPLINHLADDASFVVMGTGSWSRSYDGKAIILSELFAPLRAKMVGQITLTTQQLIADGDHVVVQAKGHNTTIDGKAYENTYCNVIRLEAGLIKEWLEYCDTLLIEAVLGRPPAVRAD